jgi:hypothetical protein
VKFLKHVIDARSNTQFSSGFAAPNRTRRTGFHSLASQSEQAVISHFTTMGPSSIHRPTIGAGETNHKEYIMKAIVLATALVATTAFGAFAQQAPVALSSAITSQIMTWVPDADLSNLTNVQYAQIVSLFANSENLRTGNDPIGQVKVILNAQ